MSKTDPTDDKPNFPKVEAASPTHRNTTIFGVLVALFSLVLVAGVMSRGCSNSGGSQGAVIIHDNGEYLQASDEAHSLTIDIFPKLSTGEPLSDPEKNQLKESLRLYEGMLAYLPTKPIPHFTAGQVSEALGDHKGAVKHYEAYLSATLNDDSANTKVTRADTHLLLSQAYLNEQQYDKALDEANEALKLFPGTANYLVARASAYAQLNKKKEALDDLSEALTKDPTNRRAQGLYHFLDHASDPKPDAPATDAPKTS